MTRAILITVLILSALYLGGCVVIACDEHKHPNHHHAVCEPPD